MMKTAILAAMLGSAAAFAPAQQVRDTPDCTFSADVMIWWYFGRALQHVGVATDQNHATK